MSVRKQQNSLGKRKAEDLEEIGQDVAYLKRLFQRDTVPIETMEDFQDPWDLYTEPQHVHQQPLPYRKHLRSDGWDLVPERPFKRTRTRSKNEHVGCSNDVDEDDKQAKVAWSKKLPEESVDETEPEPISEVSKAGNVRVDYKELDQTDISPDQSLQRKIWDEFWTSCSLDVNMPDIAEDAAKTEMHTGICSDNSSEDLDKMDWVAFRTDKIVYRPSGTAIDYVGAHIPRAPEDLTLGIDALSQEVTAADLDLVSKDSDNNLSGSSALSVSIDAIKATRYEQTQLRAWGGSAKVFIDSGSNNRSGSILVKDTAAITWDDSSDEGSFGEDKDSASDRSSETSASLVIDVGALTGAGHHVKANAEDGDGASVVQGGLLQGSSSSSPPSIASVEMDDIDEEIREDGSEVDDFEPMEGLEHLDAVKEPSHIHQDMMHPLNWLMYRNLQLA